MPKYIKKIEDGEVVTEEVFFEENCSNCARLETELKEIRSTNMALLRLLDEANDQNRKFRNAFVKASRRVRSGDLKPIMFRCSRCRKETPLIIDGLLASAKAIKGNSDA